MKKSIGRCSGHRALVLTATAIFAAAVTALGIALSSGSVARASSAAAGDIPPSVITQLTSIAQQQAAINGDAQPTNVIAVQTTHAAALTVATPGDILPEPAASESVYVITMQGSFLGKGFSSAPGASAPAGSYLSIVVDASTFWVTDEGLSQDPPPVSPSSLGPTIPLPVGASGSTSG